MPSQKTSWLIIGLLSIGSSAILTQTTSAIEPTPEKAPAGTAKPADPIQKAEYTPGKGFQVNGKPFFPIMLYSAKTSPEELAEFHKQNFNVLTVNKPEDAKNAAEGGFYLAQHAYAKAPTQLQATLFGIAVDSPNISYKKDTIAKTREDLAKVQKLIPDRPVFNAVGYWYNPQDIDNEASAVEKNLIPEKAQYEDVINAIDVSALYLYPVPYQPISTVGDAVVRAKKASEGKKAVVPILQLFTWAEKNRYPSPDELRGMVYLALAAGADGIGYYDYSYVTGKKGTNIAAEQPELWKTAGRVNRELAQFFQITQGAAQVPLPDQKGVFARAWKTADGYLVLAANATDEKKTVDIAKLAQGKKTKPDCLAYIPKGADDAKPQIRMPQSLGEVNPREVWAFIITDAKAK